MSKLKREMEIVAFAKIGNFEGLKQAECVIEQTQIERFIPNKGRVRVRKTTGVDGSVFEATVKGLKRPSEGSGGTVMDCPEENIPATPSYFEAFKLIAEKMFVKKRYIFPGKKSTFTKDGVDYHLPPVKYEVDVYSRHDGKIVDWCKIDVEIGDLLQYVKNIPELKGVDISLDIKIKDLPFIPQEAFIVGDNNSEAQRRLVRKLWEVEYPHNPLGGALTPTQPSIANTTGTQTGSEGGDSGNTDQPSEAHTTEGEHDGKENTEGSVGTI